MDKQVEDMLKLNRNRYRKYSVGKIVDKVFKSQNGKYIFTFPIVEFTPRVVYINDWAFNIYDLRNLMKVITDEQIIKYVHLNYPVNNRTLSNANGSEMLKKWWKYKKEKSC